MRGNLNNIVLSRAFNNDILNLLREVKEILEFAHMECLLRIIIIHQRIKRSLSYRKLEEYSERVFNKENGDD